MLALLYKIVYNLSMEQNRGHIKDFHLYMLGLRRYNSNKPPEQQGKFRKHHGDTVPEFTKMYPGRDYSALREDTYTLRQDLFLARIKKLPGPDRRRLLFGLAFIEGYTVMKTSLQPVSDPQER